ncbi:MAG TPA: PIN domain-containing protein [Candidatus Desulfofervidus auxilii]|uniref:PIN domain-containing protein n=1 Tax=Desulfofervidus auxilii TaxID=1621989 RepID=A0A7C0Y9M2_DESA2|nr:PIN domain-containing protein [Candidatus Desulfofervidus auxilii]
MNYFFDTSALVKHFCKEKGSEVVTKIILESSNIIWISELSILEIFSALYKKYRIGELEEESLKNALEGIRLEIKFFKTEPLSSIIVYEAINLLSTYAKSYNLRTLDSLQLATFNLISEKDWIFVAADEKLCNLVNQIGYNVINPEKI